MADGSPTDLWPQQKEILAVVEAAVVAKQPGFRSVFPHGTPYRVLIDFVFLLTNVMFHFFYFHSSLFLFFFVENFFPPRFVREYIDSKLSYLYLWVRFLDNFFISLNFILLILGFYLNFQLCDVKSRP